ncbi:DoxX family protein [Spirillospora sp. NPDC047279]|uniref:DoxX family protein n=1 Tax=Spirillospora sp. NPDC047279 TaxID=3155478 RepID=UPI00340897BB
MLPARRFPVLPDVGLLIGRLALGAVFIAHGWQKLTETGHAGVTRMFDAVGVPMPSVSATFATWLELLGGIALVLGVLVPLAGLLLAVNMAGAFWFVHMDKGFFVDKGGYEFVMILGATALLLAFTGAGRFSVDHVLFGGRGARERETVPA